MSGERRRSNLPMFPLGTVLVPHAPLPLRVFEPRYQELMHVCLEGDQRFGVVLIEAGSEVGGGDRRSGVGTLARIVQADRIGEGQWALLAIGEERLVVERWLPDDPYPCADVVLQPDASPFDESALAPAERAVRQALALVAELDEPAAPYAIELAAEPTVAAWQLVAIAPLGPFDKQQLLAETDPSTRLHRLTQLAADAREVFAHRLSGG